ncbi:bcl-2-like protein 12 isoform X2 [Rhinatrema bivittatum]|nr:bcl-2-like protein 12 isoform X2 [Rhinatrema bivittatum]
MENHCQTSDEIRFKVKEDTKLVLEAFLKHSLSTGADSTVGHVGRTYHDPKKFAHRSLKERVPDAPLKWSKRSPERRELREKGEKRQSLKRHEGKPEANLSGSSLREEISRVEEKKHGLGTSIKQLLRQSKKAALPASLTSLLMGSWRTWVGPRAKQTPSGGRRTFLLSRHPPSPRLWRQQGKSQQMREWPQMGIRGPGLAGNKGTPFPSRIC